MNKRMKILVAVDLAIMGVGLAFITVAALPYDWTYLLPGPNMYTLNEYGLGLFIFSLYAPIFVALLRETIKPKLRVRERLAGAVGLLFTGTMAVGGIVMLFR